MAFDLRRIPQRGSYLAQLATKGTGMGGWGNGGVARTPAQAGMGAWGPFGGPPPPPLVPKPDTTWTPTPGATTSVGPMGFRTPPTVNTPVGTTPGVSTKIGTMPTPAPVTPATPADSGPQDYGVDSAPLRALLGFNGSQSDVDLLGGLRTGDAQQGYNFDMSKLQPLIDKGYVSLQTPTEGGDPRYMLNYDKLPDTKFGQLMGQQGIAAYDPSMKLINDNLKYYDPNFGWVTPNKNVNTSGGGLWDAIYNYAPMAFTAGLGAMAAPVAGLGMAGNIASKLPSIAQSIGQGHFNPMSLASLGLQASGGMSGLGDMIRRASRFGGP